MSNQPSVLISDPELPIPTYVEIVVTDEELVVLFDHQPSALAAVFPDEVPTPSPPVKSAVRRSLVARRALWSNATETGYELAEPWLTLASSIASATIVRVTTDGDDSRVAVVLVGEDDVVTIAREPTGLNEVVFVAPQLVGAAVLAPFLDARPDLDTPIQLPEPSTFTLPAQALESGLEMLKEGHDEEARRRLGDAFDLIYASAGTAFRLEVIVRSNPEVIRGLDIDVFGAHDYGWLICLPRDEDPETVDLRFVDDAGLSAFITEQFAS